MLNAFDSYHSASYRIVCIEAINSNNTKRHTTESVVIFYVGYFTMFMRKYILNVRIALAQKTIWIFFLCAIFLYRKSHCRFKVFIVMRHKKNSKINETLAHFSISSVFFICFTKESWQIACNLLRALVNNWNIQRFKRTMDDAMKIATNARLFFWLRNLTMQRLEIESRVRQIFCFILPKQNMSHINQNEIPSKLYL